MSNTIEQKAIAAATRYPTNRGYAAEDVSKKREHRGYDLIAEQNGVLLKIGERKSSMGHPRSLP